MASGNRTNPLDLDAQHAIYMMRDMDIRKGDTNSGSSTILLKDLYDTTANDVASADSKIAIAANDLLQKRRGWYVNLDPAEKGLSATLSFEGNLMATTYKPAIKGEVAIAGDDDNVCGVVSNGKFYIMDIIDGRPVKYNEDGSSTTEGLAAADRITPLKGSGIPSSPTITFPKGSSQVSIIVDKESISTVSQKLNTVFWHGQ